MASWVLLSGCAYYNGMYNAKHWAKAAEGSERAGRPSEARERWQRAALHAESLVTRHPHSRWANEARVIRGRALLHMELNTEAAGVLDQAARLAGDPEQKYEALLLLGQANLALRRYREARLALDSAAESRSRERRAAALLYRGRVLLGTGAPTEALADFRLSTSPAARFDRARAALALGDTALAGAFFDSVVAMRPYVERTWLPALDSLAGGGARTHAAALVDALVERSDLTRGEKARLLLADGDRLLRWADTAGASARFRAAAALVPDSSEARGAEVGLARVALRAARSDSDLVAVRGRLDEVRRLGGGPARDADLLRSLLERLDSLREVSESPDAFWFRRSELLRDSLGARSLAAAAFEQMAVRYPESPWTPKALVAAIALGEGGADSARSLLVSRYSASPYVLAAGGGAPERFEALEDSLRQVLMPRSDAPRARPPGQPGAPARAQDADDEGVGGRRRPADRPSPSPPPPSPTPAPPPRPPPPPQGQRPPVPPSGGGGGGGGLASTS